MRRRHHLLACAGAVAALATVPGAAGAATITGSAGGTYTYTGVPGEVNSIDVQGWDDSRDITFYGVGSTAVSSAPADCAPSDLYGWTVVTCKDAAAVVVNAGDGGETVKVSGSLPKTTPVTMDLGPGDDFAEGGYGVDAITGGPGNDKINTYTGDDTVDGGDGADTIDAGAGADHVLGGAGDDVLHPDGYEDAFADVVDGGAGIDSIDSDYSSRHRDHSLPPEALAFTFAGGADDGRPGENDDVRNVERLSVYTGGKFVGGDAGEYVKLVQTTQPSEIIGNGGDDDLNGADGNDTIDGGAGNDKLDGGFDDDVITGGPGKDKISGDLAGGDCGPLWCKYPYGNDTINAVDGEVDTILCGFGTDVVNADAVDVVDKDCETINRAGAVPAPPKPLPAKSTNNGKGGKGSSARAALAGKVTLAKALKSGFTLKVTGVTAGAKLKLAATRSGKVVARGSGKASKTGAATIKLRFTKQAKRSLRRAKTLKLKVSGNGVAATVTLKRR